MNTQPLILQKRLNKIHAIEGLPICKLAGIASPSYESQTLQLEEGDSLLLYTDGLIEIDRKKPEYFKETN
jgi:sigma-B regulation protein RsbU (phosphoserine phosphatase)